MSHLITVMHLTDHAADWTRQNLVHDDLKIVCDAALEFAPLDQCHELATQLKDFVKGMARNDFIKAGPAAFTNMCTSGAVTICHNNVNYVGPRPVAPYRDFGYCLTMVHSTAEDEWTKQYVGAKSLRDACDEVLRLVPEHHRSQIGQHLGAYMEGRRAVDPGYRFNRVAESRSFKVYDDVVVSQADCFFI